MFLNGHAEPATSRPNPIAPRLHYRNHRASREDGLPEQLPIDSRGVYTGGEWILWAANFNCDAGTLHALTSANFDITFNGIDGERWNAFNMLGSCGHPLR